MKIFSPILKGTTTVAQGTTNLSGSFTGSLLGTAATASYADNFTVGGTLTAQTINVQIITSSIEFNTGSTRNGALSTNTHQFTGSVLMSGSLGIGTSSPGSPLTFYQSAFNKTTLGDARVIRLENSDPTVQLNSRQEIGFGYSTAYQPVVIGHQITNNTDFTNGSFYIAVRSGITNSAPTQVLTVTSAGQVGIGTSTPNGNFRLEVSSSFDGVSIISSQSSQTLRLSSATNNNTLFRINNFNGNFYDIQSNVSDNSLAFEYNDGEKLRINALGFTKANNAGSYRSGAALEGHEFSDNSSNSFNHFTIYASSTSTLGTLLRVVSDRNTTNNTYNLIDAGGPSVDFIVRDSSNCVNTNGSYGAISDIRLKENIVDTSPKLDDLLRVKVRNYNLKSNPSLKQIGVIAQELEDVFPGMIEEALDNKTNEITKSVKYSVFVPMLIKAIQELSAKNTLLEERLTALENN